MDHVHNANGNYGIVSFTLKPLLGTYCHHAREVLKSSSVYHLGCDVQETRRYPYATEVSGAPLHERPRSAFTSDLKATP